MIISSKTFKRSFSMTLYLFTTIDYVLFAGMMLLSSLIGVYYGFFAKRKQNNTAEYLLGSKKMGVWPVAISLTATHISATTLIGVPAEMYKHGIQYWACTISGLMVTLSLHFIFVPVFHELQVVSVYEYLERRYNSTVRKLASLLYMIFVVIISPLLVYVPALAFSQVSGINLHVITPIICCVCIFYTTFGGLRAVIWTDTLQFSSMIVSILIVMVLGTSQVGGIANVFKIADRGNRLIWFNMDPDPFVRDSFWMISIGLSSMWISNVGVTPECIQRFISIPKLKDAKKVVWIFGIGHIIIKLISVYNGLLIFSKYEKCDPIYNGDVGKYDQIFPYYVMDVARNIPGLPGMFVVGALSAALSTMSSYLNSVSGAAYEDFIKPMFPKATEKRGSQIMKLIAFCVGCICLALVFVVENLGGVFSIGIAFSGVTTGTILGLFTMGMTSTRFNSKGAIWGSIVSLSVVSFIVFGAQVNIYDGSLRYPSLPFNIEECGAVNRTLSDGITPSNSTYYIFNEDADNSSVPWIFKLGFMYYSIVGTLLVAIVGYPVSIMTGGTQNLDHQLLAPIFRKLYKKENEKNLQDMTFINPEEIAFINPEKMEVLKKVESTN
ncbi:unnamed protein product [Diamesa tonsa]